MEETYPVRVRVFSAHSPAGRSYSHRVRCLHLHNEHGLPDPLHLGASHNKRPPDHWWTEKILGSVNDGWTSARSD